MKTATILKTLFTLQLLTLTAAGCQLDAESLLGKNPVDGDPYYGMAVSAACSQLIEIMEPHSWQDSGACPTPSGTLYNVMTGDNGTMTIGVRKLPEGEFPVVSSIRYKAVSAGEPDIRFTCAASSSSENYKYYICTPESDPVSKWTYNWYELSSDPGTHYELTTLSFTHPTCSSITEYSRAERWEDCSAPKSSGYYTDWNAIRVEGVKFTDLWRKEAK